jgi:hypothetical protein
LDLIVVVEDGWGSGICLLLSDLGCGLVLLAFAEEEPEKEC